MLVFDWDDFEARYYMRLLEADAKTERSELANGRNIWRNYQFIEVVGDQDDQAIIQGVSVLRALFYTDILEQLEIESVSKQCVVRYKAAKNTYTYYPGVGEGYATIKAKMVIERQSGWEFTVTVEKEGSA